MSKRSSTAPARNVSPDQPADNPFQVCTSGAFDRADFTPTWLVPDILAAGLPGVLGGPRKAFKTSLMVDLAVSLATATPFLGRFPVPSSRRVAVFSGERDPGGLRDAARRVCQARRVALGRCAISWAFRLPRLYDEADLSALKEFLTASRTEAVFIDPLYLCLLPPGGGEAAANLYEVGPLLDRAAGVCLAAGATPVFVHYTTKGAGQSAFWGGTDLGDLAYAGIGEFVRQWVLLQRPPGKAAPGRHRLVMTAGGSAGQAGRWEVLIDEGTGGGASARRAWRVEVRDPGRGPTRPAATPAPEVEGQAEALGVNL